MRLKNMPPDYENIIDLRPEAVGKSVDGLKTDGKGDLEIPDNMIPKTDYENPYDPDVIEDIGFDQQPLMRGYGKVQKSLNKWRVR